MKKVSLLLGVVCALGLKSAAQNIVINEIVAKNDAGLQDPDFNEFTDWVELKNTTGSPIDISGYYLTDSNSDTTKWAFPNGTSVPGNGFLVVYADKVNINLHTNFALSSAGENVRLFDPQRNLLDEMDYPELYDGYSYGRVNNGWAYLTNLTPGTANNDLNSYSAIENRPTISPASGAYANAQSVSFQGVQGETIYYTTDGSNPTTSSTVYTGPFQVSTTTVVKAIAVQSGKLNSQIESATYLIGVSHSLPIVNITAENYQAPTGGNKLVIDGKVKVDFIETNGAVAFSQYADFEVSGNSSADLPQIQGKITANKKYGDDSFNYKMYPNKGIEKFESFLLRNSSQDFILATATHMRDGLMSRIMSTDDVIDMPFEAYRPAVIYVNGKFEGQINVREDDDKYFAAHNYGQNMDTYQKENVQFSSGIDITTAQGRSDYAEFINLQQQRYYYSLFGFCAQGEQGGRIWRNEVKQNQFTFHLHDWDQAFVFDPDYFGYDPLLWISINNYSDSLKKESLQFYAAQINLIYDSERTLSILDDLVAQLRPEIQNHVDFTNGLTWWNGSTFTSLQEWDDNVAFIRGFLTQRPGEMIARIGVDHPSESLVDLTHSVNDSEYGYLRIHEIKSTEESETGKYFAGMPIRLHAIAKPGYKFSHWTGASTSTDDQITISISGASSIQAVFVPTGALAITINEIQSKNSNTISDEENEFNDWIEFHNDGDDDFDLADCYLTDNPGNLKKWKILRDGDKTIVPSKGKLILWADQTPMEGVNHVNFKLDDNESVLLVHPDGQTILNELSFGALNTGEVFQRFPDGGLSTQVCDKPTPNASNTECISVSVNELVSGIEVYPNPTQGVVNIKGAGIQNVMVYNSLGANVSVKVTSNNSVDLSRISNGVYFLVIQTNSGIGNYKIVKK